MVIIKTKLTQKEFIEANLVVRYSRIISKILVVIGILYAMAAAVISFLWPEMASATLFIPPIVILFLPPLSTWLQARSFYKSNSRISEPIEYDFGDDNLTIKGESFTTTVSWNKFYKVKRTKNWIFLYSNKLVANPVSRKDFFDSDLDQIKKILAVHNVKNNL